MRKFLRKSMLPELLSPELNKIWGLIKGESYEPDVELYWISYVSEVKDEEQAYNVITTDIDEKTKRIEYSCHKTVIKHTGINNKMTGFTRHLHGNCTNLSGDASGLTGDCSKLSGDATGIVGCCTNVEGNFDACWITDEEREKKINIEDITEIIEVFEKEK